jgi:hypothetical protein
VNNAYHFRTRWRAAGTVEEVYDLISEPLGYPRWWPSVYLDVREISPGDAGGLARRIGLHTKGWLPYTLRWESVATALDRPHRLSLRAAGDFEGRGTWLLRQNSDFVELVFDWELRAEKPLLRYFSFLLRPVFSANHRWAMARGEDSLRLELARRRALSSARLDTIPPPPGPNTTSGFWLIAGGAVMTLGLIALLRSIQTQWKGERRN